MFVAISDCRLANAIERSRRRVIYVAPGMGENTARALIAAMEAMTSGVTIIIDGDADSCRIGYGDEMALKILHEAATHHQIPLRRHEGLRIGLLVTDDEVAIWAPTARSVEPDREEEQPNGIVFSERMARAVEPEQIARAVEEATGADGSAVLPEQADIGQKPLTAEELEGTVEELNQNPPEPFDLARRTRVFSTRFQFVECEVRGAEWVDRRLRLSNMLLNADLPEEVLGILNTQVRPFQAMADVELDVPLLVDGEIMYRQNGERILKPTTQSAIMSYWKQLRDTCLRQVKGFGWLIRRDQLADFRSKAAAFEEVLKAWVVAFRRHIENEHGKLVAELVDAVKERIERSPQSEDLAHIDLGAEFRRGLERLRIVEPKVRIVTKNIAWESSRDGEFMDAIAQALPREELEGWFEEFTAARAR